jgi:glycine/D-amino acid oxidase-like deaminating enzyme
MTVARSFSAGSSGVIGGARRHAVVIGAGAVGSATAIEALCVGLRVTVADCRASGRRATAAMSCWPSGMVTWGCAARRERRGWWRNCWRVSTQKYR